MSAPPNFDRVARIYRWAEYLALGTLLERTREHFLPQLEASRHALVLGDGDGRFLARLLARNLRLRATAVDSSAHMLALLRQRCAPASNRLNTIHADALTMLLPAGPDLIVTHFFLDCLTQHQTDVLAQNLAQAAQPGTLWLISDFAIPSNGLRLFARLYVRTLYLCFQLLTGLRVQHLPDPAAALEAAGFVRLAHHRRLGGLLYTELWQRSSIHLSPAQVPRQSTIEPAHRSGPMDQSNPIRPAHHPVNDAQSDPEPAVPSLPEPDTGVFHHEPATRTSAPSTPASQGAKSKDTK